MIQPGKMSIVSLALVLSCCSFLLLSACVRLRPIPSAEEIDKLMASVPPPPSTPVYAAKAFTPGASLKTKEGVVQFSENRVGELLLPSGKIVASDVFFSSLAPPPLDRAVTPGKYPVSIAIAHYPSNGGQRIAFAKVAFSTAPIVSWQLASEEGAPEQRRKNAVYGYGVDSGTGCFTDFETANEMHRMPDTKALCDRIIAALDGSLPPDCRNADLLISPGHNLVAFSSGVGDGLYVSYWGLDAKGKVCALVTDFDLFP